MRIWLDTDIGSDVDDALALAYIVAHPDLELVGLSTVFGDIPLRTKIAQALLGIAEAAPVPVLPGLGVPFSERRQGIMFGHEGIGLFDDPNPVLRLRSESGSQQRIEAIGRALDETEPDVIVAIGPMTNIGALAQAGVTLPPLAIMGGKFRDVMLPGMVAEITEWNWHCDPTSVQQSLAAATTAPLVVPAEVTFQTRLSDADIELLDRGQDLNRTLAELCRQWLEAQRRIFGIDKPIVALHDPLTVALLVEPDLCTYEDRRIAIGAGAIVYDPDLDAPGIEVRAAVTVDAAAARDHIMDVLVGQ